MLPQAVYQKLLHNNPRLAVSYTVLLDLTVNVATWGDDVAEFVMLNYVDGQVRYFSLHVCISCHWGIQIKVFYVHGHELCSLSRYDAVDQKFDSD